VPRIKLPPAGGGRDTKAKPLPAPKTSPRPVVDTIGTLPALYARWLETILPGPLPVEIEATCSDCAMCPRPGEEDIADRLFFTKDSKCCTYSPSLPNFLAGSILADSAASMVTGRSSLTTRLQNDSGASPLGVLPTPVYNLLYRHSQQAFGQNSSLRCPHLDSASGTCSIWSYREPTCITWFCKHVRGKIGQTFWMALQVFLTSINKELALWAVLQLDIGSDALACLGGWRERVTHSENLQPHEIDSRQNAKAARKIWGRWWGRETEFYVECARLVSGLDFPDIVKICGPEVEVSVRLLRQAHARLGNKKIPTHLKLGRFKVEAGGPDTVRVWSYSRLDPLDVPVQVFKVLVGFNVESTADVLSEINSEAGPGMQLDSRMLRTLIDFGILEESPDSMSP
jgi:hypothetical protein